MRIALMRLCTGWSAHAADAKTTVHETGKGRDGAIRAGRLCDACV
jgi:hypothetical protein